MLVHALEGDGGRVVGDSMHHCFVPTGSELVLDQMSYQYSRHKISLTCILSSTQPIQPGSEPYIYRGHIARNWGGS
jgi:hypothetical protein